MTTLLTRSQLLLAVAAFSIATACAAAAAPLPPDVLARNRWMDLTHHDYEAALSRVPEKLRWEFATSPKRIQGLLNGLLVTKTLAAQARVHGTRAASSLGESADAESDQALAAAEIQRVENDARTAFERRKTQFEAKAREIYTLDRDKYREPEEVRLSDIAVSIKERGDEAARARAEEARKRLAAGDDFATVAREYSDDPTTKDKGGALPFVSRKKLAPDYAKAVFALSKVGEISTPIKAPLAYHVVRLEERHAERTRSFDEVRDSIIEKLRQKYIAEQRDALVASVHRDPDLQINQPAIDALVNPVAAVPPATAGSTAAPPVASSPAPPVASSPSIPNSAGPPAK